MPLALPNSLTALRFLTGLGWLCLVGMGNSAFAQYASDQGRFAVNQVRGCAPLFVEVIEENIPPGNTSPTLYKFNYAGNINGNIFIDEDQDYQDTVYAIPGTYKILQNLGSEFDSITIEVLEPRAPAVQVFTCINNGVFLEINDDYYDRLRIDYGNGITEEVSTELESTFHTYATPGSYSISVQGLFDAADSDNCATTDTTITTVNTLTVADVSAVTVLSGTSVRLNYSLPNPDVSYRLEVAETGSDDFTFARYNLNGEEEFIIDDPAFQTSEQSYCFRVVAVNRCDESLNLVSDVLCSITLQVEARDRQNQLNWISEGFRDYDVLRNDELTTATNDLSYLDTDVECGQTYVYQVRAESEAGRSLSAATKVVALDETVVAAPDNFGVEEAGSQLQLTWLPPAGATAYYIYRGDGEQNPVLYDPISLGDSTSLASSYEDVNIEPGASYCYRLSYDNACGNESALSEPVCVIAPRQGEVFFPNAFTPNDDGLNDIFVYRSRLVERIEMQIYNRWGELIFQTDELDVGWDGSYGGGVAPQGTYVYKVRVIDQLGNSFEQEGSFVLLNP